MEIFCATAELAAEAAIFTAQFPMCRIRDTIAEPKQELALVLLADGLTLFSNKFKPFNFKNFYNNLLLERVSGAHHELLVQAIKLKPADSYSVLDANAGLGRDSLILAAAGFAVTMVENNPYLALGLSYLCYTFKLTNLKFIYADNLIFMGGALEQFDVVYLDPMFKDGKSALSKKALQLIDLCITYHARKNNISKDDLTTLSFNNAPIMQQLGDLSSANLSYEAQLFALACTKACHKVVVKRDNKQKPLCSLPKPNYSKVGKTVRFDVYLSHN